MADCDTNALSRALDGATTEAIIIELVCFYTDLPEDPSDDGIAPCINRSAGRHYAGIEETGDLQARDTRIEISIDRRTRWRFNLQDRVPYPSSNSHRVANISAIIARGTRSCTRLECSAHR